MTYKERIQKQIDGEVKFFMLGNKYDAEPMNKFHLDELGQWEEPRLPVPKTMKEIRKLLFLKKGGVMDLDEWANIPAEGTSKTEDAEFEVIEQKKIGNGI